MAEIILKIGDEGNYEDGDILCAFNDKRIQIVHAQHICDYKDIRKTDGILPPDTLAQDYFELTNEYRFVRNGDQVTRIEIASGKEEDVSDQMDVGLYIARRKTSDKTALFGSPGQEIWYGGIFNPERVSEVWDAIESKTSEVRTDYKDWPLTSNELKHFFVVPVDDFTDIRSEELVAPILDETDPGHPVIIKSRKYKVDYLDKLDLDQETIDKIDDPSQEKPKPENISYDEAVIVTEK